MTHIGTGSSFVSSPPRNKVDFVSKLWRRLRHNQYSHRSKCNQVWGHEEAAVTGVRTFGMVPHFPLILLGRGEIALWGYLVHTQL